MSAVPASRPMTFDEFLAFEERSDSKHEFINGEIVPWGEAVHHADSMAGAAFAHNEIAMALYGILNAHRKRGGCPSYPSDLKVRTANGESFYPDATMICGDRHDRKRSYTERPTVVFEILSPSTERRDRTTKLDSYAGIESLRAVVFIASETHRVELYIPTGTGGWTVHPTTDLEGVVRLEAVGLELALAELYAEVELSDQENGA